MQTFIKIMTLSVLTASSLLSVSCNATSGALAGGGTGALVGGLIGDRTGNTATGAIIGGLGGAAVGGVIGAQNQRINQQNQQNAYQQGVNDGRGGF